MAERSKTPRFLHIAFNWRHRIKTKELEPVFDKALDWIRYAPNCWIVWSNSSVETWYKRFEKYLHEDDTVLICKLDPNEKFGIAPEWIWDWLDEKR